MEDEARSLSNTPLSNSSMPEAHSSWETTPVPLRLSGLSTQDVQLSSDHAKLPKSTTPVRADTANFDLLNDWRLLTLLQSKPSRNWTCQLSGTNRVCIEQGGYENVHGIYLLGCTYPQQTLSEQHKPFLR